MAADATFGKSGYKTIAIAVSINDGEGLACGITSAGSCCFQSYTPFCRDAECCQLVCGYDAYCCEVRWDELCATVATAGCETLGEQCGCGAKVIDFGLATRGTTHHSVSLTLCTHYIV